MSLPTIGLTLDFETGSNDAGAFSSFDYFAIRDNYCASVINAGGLALPLPHFPDQVADYAAKIDGLIVTGGNFDVNPAMYGAGETHSTVTLKERRTAFELGILRAALAANKPVLGICGGEQLLAVALGGTLIQHIPDSISDCLEHEQPNPRDEVSHSVSIQPGTLLRRITGADRIEVNSAHHQAVDQPGDGAIINCSASDGVIEGIEHSDYKFCLGVQWHPEYGITQADEDIFKAFVAACSA